MSETYDIWVLNTDFERIAVIDYYISLIWTERYSEAGDFEIYLKSDSSVFDVIKLNYYLYYKGAVSTMIIEKIEINTDVEDGNELIISGRSLESILDRRIIWPQTNLDGYLQGQVKKLIDNCLISPEDSDRKISNFTFKESTDPAITSLRLRSQYTGDNLYETICAICAAYNLGFRVTLTKDNKFQFELYKGADRSYDQDDNSFVIFSSRFDNLKSSNYYETNEDLKTISVVAGEGEGTDRRNTTVEVESGAGSGMNRREHFTDARDVSSTSGSTTLTEEAYIAKLQQRGLEKLAECTHVVTFEGEVEDGQTFTFGSDYFIGDVVQIVDEYGRDGTVRVTELVRSISTTGIEVYPTFVSTYKATITIRGNAGDTVIVSGTGYGYTITLDNTGETSIVVLTTGDYTFEGELTGISKSVNVSTHSTAYSVDLRFNATVIVQANPNVQVAIVSDTNNDIVYQGTANANGIASFTVYRYGLYLVITSYTPEEDEGTSNYNAPIVLTSIPESEEELNADYMGNSYSVDTVYIGNVTSISNSEDESKTKLYIYWDVPDELYEGMELYQSMNDYPEEPDSETYSLVASGAGSIVNISSYTGNKTAFTITGLAKPKTNEEDITYYFSAWPYLTIGGKKYYGTKRTTSHTYSSKDA